MKNLLLFGFLIAVKISSGQTTEEEYNFITKGYKIQVESGLDMKKGYELVDLGVKTAGIRSVEAKALYRVKDAKKELSAYMLIYKNTDSKLVEYICVPHPKSEEVIALKYWSVLYADDNSNSSNRLQLICFVVTYLNW